jgi:hypothetical protein
VTPTARRSAVGYLQATYQLSERRACRLVGAHRRTMRYAPRPDEEAHRIFGNGSGPWPLNSHALATGVSTSC